MTVKYGQIAGNTSINAMIYRCFEYICEEDQRKFVKKFREQPHDSDQIKHTFRELVLGAYLGSNSFRVKHDYVIDDQTPDWSILDMEGQSIEFPVLYYDFRFVNCIFTVKINRLKQILPHENFLPIQVIPGIGMLSICAFEYHDTSIRPYNEVAISVPINFPPASYLGKHTALSTMRQNIFPVYIYQLPVTSEIARDAGVYFYNYPKFLAEIDFLDREDSIEVTLREGNDLVLKMLAKKLSLKRSERFELHTFSLREKTIMHSLIEGRALKYGKKMLGRCGELELGSHKISEELKNLKMSKSAWSGLSGEGAMSKLHDPDQQWDKETLKVVQLEDVKERKAWMRSK